MKRVRMNSVANYCHYIGTILITTGVLVIIKLININFIKV